MTKVMPLKEREDLTQLRLLFPNEPAKSPLQTSDDAARALVEDLMARRIVWEERISVLRACIVPLFIMASAYLVLMSFPRLEAAFGRAVWLIVVIPVLLGVLGAVMAVEWCVRVIAIEPIEFELERVAAVRTAPSPVAEANLLREDIAFRRRCWISDLTRGLPSDVQARLKAEDGRWARAEEDLDAALRLLEEYEDRITDLEIERMHPEWIRLEVRNAAKGSTRIGVLMAAVTLICGAVAAIVQIVT